ncbi:hypothetical protein HOD29_05940 [archaeon]|jgi:hypothetical protein|nr:hypothetical protein [archaeon]
MEKSKLVKEIMHNWQISKVEEVEENPESQFVSDWAMNQSETNTKYEDKKVNTQYENNQEFYF